MKFNIETSDRICGNKYFPLAFLVISFFLLLIFSMATSPIFGLAVVDASIFKMMGHVLLSGGVPYVDYFDHKGPYMYLINAIGETISPSWGLFPIQIVWLTGSMVLWFKTARLFIRPTYSFFIVLLLSAIFAVISEVGDMTEEWSLLPCSISVYLAISFLVNQPLEKHRYWRSLVYGLCFGMVFLIRPNDAIMICGGVMTGIFLYIMFCQKQYANALVNALAFFAGAIIMAAPWIAYFAYHGALENFYFGLIGFNLHYTGGLSYNLTHIFEIKEIIIICILLILFVIKTKHQRLLWVLIPISTYILLIFGRNNYPHYYMTVIPAIILLFFAMLFSLKFKKATLIVASLSIVIIGVISVGFDRIKRVSTHLVEGTIAQKFFAYKQDIEKDKALLFLVPEEERDSIWNYGDYDSIVFYNAGIISQNPVPNAIGGQYRPFPKSMEKQLYVTLNKPLWIFMNYPLTYIYPSDSAFIADNYRLVKESGSSKFILLKRKDE